MNKCEDCNLCCKLPQINDPAFSKPSYQWCEHCEPGIQCNIYNDRPLTCKTFECIWLNADVGPRPKKAGFFAIIENESAEQHKVVTIYCEEHRIRGLKDQILKDKDLSKILENGWTYVVRHNHNQQDKLIIKNNRNNETEICYV